MLTKRFVRVAPTGAGSNVHISFCLFLFLCEFCELTHPVSISFFRYECEESFTTLNVDIRNHQNLLDSMEQYVKGDLLEGANAYHCEKCNKKVMLEHTQQKAGLACLHIKPGVGDFGETSQSKLDFGRNLTEKIPPFRPPSKANTPKHIVSLVLAIGMPRIEEDYDGKPSNHFIWSI